MVKDSVRQELESKIVPISRKETNRSFKFDKTEDRGLETSRIRPKPTDQTLLEFSDQKNRFPEWRLRVKSIVNQKKQQKEASRSLDNVDEPSSEKRKDLDEIILRAIKRIEVSREKNQKELVVINPDSEKSNGIDTAVLEDLKEVKTFPMSDEVERFKTQKLHNLNADQSMEKQVREVTSNREYLVVAEETDFYAPISQRFVASLFDLIICVFFSFVFLFPFIITGSDFLSFKWLVAFLTTCSIVTFVYMVVSTTFFGKTAGMKLFSLEVVTFDEESEEAMYPTLHQATVNTLMYFFSLLTLGLGFLPILFDREKRALHDLISGTVVIKS